MVRVRGLRVRRPDEDTDGRVEPFRPVTAISARALELILSVSGENHPNEFGGTMRAKDGVITEVVFLPGTVGGRSSAILQLHMLPIDFSVVGSVHSHPGPSAEPSEEDLNLFRKFGMVHIIAAWPYRRSSWRSYDFNGNPLRLEVIEDGD